MVSWLLWRINFLNSLGIEGLGLSSAQEDLLNSIRQNYKKCKEDLKLVRSSDFKTR